MYWLSLYGMDMILMCVSGQIEEKVHEKKERVSKTEYKSFERAKEEKKAKTYVYACARARVCVWERERERERERVNGEVRTKE